MGTRCGHEESCSDFAMRMYRTRGFLVASAKSAFRLARCRPRYAHLRRRLIAAGGLVFVAFAFWGGPAAAQVEGPCTITVTTEGQTGDVNSHATPQTALPVQYGQIVHIDTVSTGAITAHQIELELAGISWIADEGLDSGNSWGGEAEVSQYAGGFGLHKVTGVSFGPGACSGTAYVLVEGGNPLGGPVGAGAAAATGVGALALATTTVRAGKEGSDAVEELNPKVGPKQIYIDGHYVDVAPPEPDVFDEGLTPEERMKLIQQEMLDLVAAAAAIEKKTGRPFTMCALALPRAILFTMGTMLAGAGAPAAPLPYSLRRVPWRPRFSLVGMGGGLLTALGTLVLLQQYGVVYPTLTVTIVGLLLGVFTSVLIPSLVRIASVGRVNRAIAAAEWRLNQPARDAGLEGEPSPVWAPSHEVPEGGMIATEAPDPSSEVVATIEAGLPVQVVESRGDWAQVVAENGWWGWVDARELKKLAKRKPRTSSPAKTPQREESQPTGGNAVPADWYPDPSGEARFRYWDGTTWTEHTSD